MPLTTVHYFSFPISFKVLIKICHQNLFVSESHLVVSNSLNPMDCSLSGSSVHGILQARMLEWVTIPFSRGSSWPKDQTQVSCIAGRFLTVWATREAFCLLTDFLSLSPLNFKLRVGRNYFHLSHFFSYLQCLAQCLAGSRLYKKYKIICWRFREEGIYVYIQLLHFVIQQI